MTDVYINSGDQLPTPSDAELILEVRGGDVAAYGALYERHAAAARRLALRYVRNAADAEDVVADAFARVLRVLQQGGGPDQMFRAYLFTVVKNVAVELSKGHQRLRVTDDEATFESALFTEGSGEDPAVAGFERTVVSKAYRNLPERWQAVLWYTEVEGYTPAQIAPILGLTPNGVSALAYRAREGLRVGYLQQHLTSTAADGCRTINPLLGGYVRGALAHREVAKIDSHLKTCGGCRTLVLELSDVAHGMRGVIAPLVLGAAGLAVMGALPVGALVGASAGAAAGVAAAGTSAGAGAAGIVGTSTAGAAAGAVGSAGAAAGSAGAAAAGTAAAGSAGAAAAGTAVAGGAAAGTAAASTAAGTAVASSMVATAAGAGAVVGGTGVAAAVGAVAVAAVGVVTVLQAMAPQNRDVPLSAPTVAVAQWPSTGLTTPTPTASPSPTETGILADATAFTFPALPTPPELSVASISAAVLEPRVPQRVRMTVANGGQATAHGTTVRFALDPGLEPSFTSGVYGMSAPSGSLPLAADALACGRAADDSRAVVCTLGDVPGGDTRTVAFDVVAHSGGVYGISGSVWADGLPIKPVTVPSAAVASYGAELSAQVGTITDVPNPGIGDLPLGIVNTGDVVAPAGWSVGVTLPDGLVFAGADGLSCTAGADPRALTCTAAAATPLSPNERVSGVVHVVAPATAQTGPLTVSALPAAVDSGHVVSGTGSVTVLPAWQGAGAGATGTLQAQCQAVGGLSTADAIVAGTYRNATAQSVKVRLDAGSSSDELGGIAPGGTATLKVHNGIRVPVGAGTWTLTAEVAGTKYSTTVPAGTFGAADCYDPSWAVSTTVVPQNVNGQVRLAGTITNLTQEPFRVALSAAGTSAEAVRLDAGATTTLVIDTGLRALSAGTATFDLYRWVADVDGDEPTHGVQPATPPTVAYGGATLAPAVGTPDTRGTSTGQCTYDAATETSWRTVRVPLDNTSSTLPVTFTVAGKTATLGGGEQGFVEVPVAFGTTALDVLADGRAIGQFRTQVESCATLEWPQGVSVAADSRCTAADDPQVAVTVSDGEDRAYLVRVRLADGSWSDQAAVSPGGSRTIALGLGSGLVAQGGRAEVELLRSVEGQLLSVPKTVAYDGVSCVVEAPDATLVLGDVKVDKHPKPVSTRTAQIVLDNTRSNVPVRFTVSGSADIVQVVAAGATETADAGTVVGRDGASYTVEAADWKTTLEVPTFTGTTGWCAAPWDRHAQIRGEYEKGDVVSRRSVNYTYVGAPTFLTGDATSADPSPSAEPGQGNGPGREKRNKPGNPFSLWPSKHGGPAYGWLEVPGYSRAWDAVGTCEAR